MNRRAPGEGRRPACGSTHLGFFDQGTGDLLRSPYLPRAQRALSGEVEAQAVGGHQGAPLVRLPQDSAQGKVQDVRGRVVAHDEPPPSLQTRRRLRPGTVRNPRPGGHMEPAELSRPARRASRLFQLAR